MGVEGRVGRGGKGSLGEDRGVANRVWYGMGEARGMIGQRRGGGAREG